MTGSPSDTHIRYRLEYEEKTSRLVGVVEPPKAIEPGSVIPPVTLRSLLAHIEETGFADYFFLSNSVELFLKKIQRFETGRYVLAEKRDAKIQVSVSHDKSTARVQTDKAWGGKPLDREWILAQLEKSHVAEKTVDQDKLNELLTSSEPLDIIIARSIPAKNGSHGRLEPLLASAKLVKHDFASEAAIDQHEVQEFTVVDPGEGLMRRFPPTSGSDGTDVTGKPIRARAGKDVQFNKPFEGVELSVDDENLLVATIKGHPVFNKFGVKVDPMMMVDAVDIHTGNINFDGSLLVKTNVEAGFRVAVSGDIFVKGSVFKATLKAGGSIQVNGGVNADDIDDEHGCHLEASGDTSAKYFHHANVHCGGDLNAHEYIMQCRITAEGYVLVGQSRGRGCIIGGHCRSNAGVRAKVLGSEAYVTTSIALGADNVVHRAVAELSQQLQRRRHEEQQLSKILAKVQADSNPTNVGRTTLDKARKIENTVALLREKITHMETKLEELNAQQQVADELVVNVADKIYPNVVISICGRPWSCEETRRRCQVRLEGEHLVLADHP